ncbi:MAG TPA: Maf family protein [Leptolinea sp.]
MQIILASNSPRRRELLSLTGWKYSVSPANIDESPRKGEKPEAYVLRLAAEKAAACQTDSLGLILAADTIVVENDQLLGKPEDPADAIRMLQQLRGHAHKVMTAISLYDRKSNRIEKELCITDVPMRDYTDEDVAAYVKSGDPLDKAGAYAIQHKGFHPVEDFHGCFASVMGLPLCHLRRLAARFDLPVASTLVEECERVNHYACPIYRQVENGVEIG